MKKIIVATDFSITAFNAAEYAAEMALVIKTDLHLLHIFQMPVNYAVPALVSVKEMLETSEKDMASFKEQLIRGRTETIGITTEVKMGFFFNELKTVCEELSPYAVVMGSQGTTAAERLIFGSHTINAMKHLEWPLITIPTTSKFSAIKKIGLACDFDNIMDTIPINEIRRLACDFNAELNVVNVAEERMLNRRIVSHELRKKLADLNPQYHFIEAGKTEEAVMEFAQINHIDLLVVLPRRHSVLDTLIHKSHTKKFILHSQVPVMALHAE